MLGTHLKAALAAEGFEVRGLSRKPQGADEWSWDPERGQLAPDALDWADAVVHLAGSPIARRWSKSVKNEIRRSRKLGTRLLAERMARAETPPQVLLSASGINFYGDRREGRLTEESEAGKGFLAEVCRDWEAATESADAAGIRVAWLRTGVVLSPEGGALARLLPIFKSGLGGPVGSGNQRMSWILPVDFAGGVVHLLRRPELAGAVNMTSPGAVTNREFAQALGKALGKAARVPAPALAVRLAFGEMGRATVLGDLEVEPRRLLDSGYDFRFPEIGKALNFILGKSLQRS